MAVFEASGLSAGYDGRAIVRGVSFSCPAGSVTGVLGANGCGKTTLLRAICGLLPHEGRCMLDGAALEGLSPRGRALLCGYMPQRSGIEIDMTAQDVVLMGFHAQLPLLAQPTRAMREAANAALARVGLAARAQDNYQTLSVGQKQLCMLARTLAAPRQLLVLDEPESAMDVRHRQRMADDLTAYAKETGCVVLMALHDPQIALGSCDQLLLLEGGSCAGLICPKTDSLAAMETALAQVYGPVSLVRCRDRRGDTHLMMLKEREAGQ